ncbi:phenylalanine--tRNA ligase subunit beta [Klenkia sp. PcliD-1-E]|uniref:phenylalanine--tRNA ligase subunit beta n=1 Tax=Klenkia sp. PcliD-1-E TaxID=2954492 RepID=UPI002096C592|nr:phenylalanine--tRNA ligase subunit beta [Klenkia sp. PcliD-1-E]MCO7221394.1 phenylalanine--tRNA ligase subunit beta [Klenkia sp. PcliD-1-E]
MRVPISWLSQHVDLPAGTGVEELDAAFVRQGLEVDAVLRTPETTGPLVVGKVLEIEELTGFKKPIRYCRVDVGNPGDAGGGGREGRGIVCGARNFAVGDLVVVALPGVVLPGEFAIAARETYGRVSDGMICSVRELGIGEDHEGILVLGTDGIEPGTPAAGVLGLDDVVLDLEVTTDRGYCMAIRGVAREVAAALGAPWQDPAAATPPAWSGEPAWAVEVADPARCDRFSMIAMEGLDPAAPTPWWMRRRLTRCGVRSISLAVDVTNYVMLELGQPMHAFDRDAVRGPVVVRTARPGERLTTLDGADRALDADDLLITDDSGPIGLAGVMGGSTTEVSGSTTALLLEAAHWEPTGIGRGVRRHKLPSEAAKRFERGTDPDVTVVALARAAELLSEFGGARVAGGVVDVDTRVPRPAITLAADRPQAVAGIPIAPDTVVDALRTVGCAVDADGALLAVTPPSWRPDLTDPADLVEEVVRAVGYDEIPGALPTAPPGRGLTPAQRRRRSVGRALADAGYTEAPAYPFVGPTALTALGLPTEGLLTLRNPLSEQEPAMRPSLLPGLLATLARNIGRGQRDLAVFELGVVFTPGEVSAAPLPPVDRRPDDDVLAALLGAVPAQPWHVGVALSGLREPRGHWGPGRAADWADAVEAARTVAGAAGVELVVRAGDRLPWHPGRCAELVVDGVVVGWAGELHPRVCADLELPARTCGMELDLDALPEKSVAQAPEISSFPPVRMDAALVVESAKPEAAVRETLRRAAGDLLEDLQLFDVYEGPSVGEGRKSLAYAFTFRAPDRTLTGEQAREAFDAAVAAAAADHGAVLRA